MPQKRYTPNSTFKKVVVLRLDRQSQAGYVDPAQLGRGESVELLTVAGEHRSLPLDQVKGVYFVRDFSEPFEPARKFFLSRPRQEGLWVRLLFHDGDLMDALVPNDLLGLLERGIHVTPPDSRGNSLRLFIPRSALREFRVLGVVGTARHARTTGAASSPQGNLFGSGSA